MLVAAMVDLDRPDSEDITSLLIAWSEGDEQAFERLIPQVYGQLRQLALSQLRLERASHTLQTSALVHEAFLRLVKQNRVRWRDRSHFFALAAQMMRRILVDHARRHRFRKRGGGSITVRLEDAGDAPARHDPEILQLNEALEKLAQMAPQQARIIELRYFGGLTKEEIAEVIGISSATVTRRWRLARAWLYNYFVRGECDEL